jgi:DNA-binding transcriptional regulator YhcF (GntR family)
MNDGREPLYIKVYEKYKSQIVSAKLTSGTKLPLNPKGMCRAWGE